MKIIRKKLLAVPVAVWAFTLAYTVSSSVMAKQSVSLGDITEVMMAPGPSYGNGCTTKTGENQDNTCAETDKCPDDANRASGCNLHYGTGKNEHKVFCDCGTGQKVVIREVGGPGGIGVY